jgi:ATP-dependent exoDNAse (exonuclease V) alpha subunit
MSPAQFFRLVLEKFPFEPTAPQAIFFEKVAHYLLATTQDELFVLKGFAGTGKTTVISALVNHLQYINQKYVLLAPTGRAAKVMANYAEKQAYTIHKRIYYPKKNKNGGMGFVLQANKFKNTVFIVDEASMIGDSQSENTMYVNGSLLDDLLFYVDAGQNCKLILVGDTAQLPPIQSNVSPALNSDSLALHYNKNIIEIELDEVMRQAEKSGILYNATELRGLLKRNFFSDFQFKIKGFNDIVRLQNGYDIEDAIHQAYANFSIEDTAFIVRSNKRANQYNQQIRSKILGKDSELAIGDFLMVVKNNYFWLKETSEAGFIANGDIIEVLAIRSIKELYGFKFAEVTIRMVDYPNELPFETLLLLDTLTSESPSLTYEESNKLYQEVLQDYEEERQQYRKLLKVKSNPYFNALQVKFSYAITCHKSQGGQWCTVFIEQPYLPDGIDKEYVRWLYTAVTRAQNKLYLIGFKDDFFES